MMTIIWTFLKNPKNLIITILAAAVLTFGAVVLFQRGSLAKSNAKVKLQSAEIENLKAVNKAYQKTVEDYADQVIKLQKLNEAHQAIGTQTAKEIVKIKYIKNKCVLEGDDAKIVNGVFSYFNTGRLLDN